MARAGSIARRGKPVEVHTTDTAEWDIADYGIAHGQLEIIGKALMSLPVSRLDDVVEGDVRYRQFGDAVAVFVLSATPDTLHFTICGLRPVGRLEATAVVLKSLQNSVSRSTGPPTPTCAKWRGWRTSTQSSPDMHRGGA